MRFDTLRLNVARSLVVIAFVWPFLNYAYVLPGSTAEINFIPVFLAAAVAPEVFFEDLLSISILSVTAMLALVWGPEGSSARLVVGTLPCLLILGLRRKLLQKGSDLIPASLPYRALQLFVGFSLLQYINFNIVAIIPDWLTNSLMIVIPRYMDAPYDDTGLRGVQGWASEPSSAAMTCFAFCVVAMQQEPKKKWSTLSLFALLTALNKSIYSMFFLVLLAFICLFGMRKKIYAVLAIAPVAAALIYFISRSGRLLDFRNSLLVYGVNSESNHELMRVVQILYPLKVFPHFYQPVNFFGIDEQPLGLLALLVGYGSVIGCILYYRIALRYLLKSESKHMPLVLTAIFLLSILASPDFVPAIVAFAYALSPKLLNLEPQSGRRSWFAELKRVIAEAVTPQLPDTTAA